MGRERHEVSLHGIALGLAQRELLLVQVGGGIALALALIELGDSRQLGVGGGGRRGLAVLQHAGGLGGDALLHREASAHGVELAAQRVLGGGRASARRGLLAAELLLELDVACLELAHEVLVLQALGLKHAVQLHELLTGAGAAVDGSISLGLQWHHDRDVRQARNYQHRGTERQDSGKVLSARGSD